MKAHTEPLEQAVTLYRGITRVSNNPLFRHTDRRCKDVCDACDKTDALEAAAAGSPDDATWDACSAVQSWQFTHCWTPDIDFARSFGRVVVATRVDPKDSDIVYVNSLANAAMMRVRRLRGEIPEVGMVVIAPNPARHVWRVE